MVNIFDSIRLLKPKCSVFDLSYENKLSFDMGKLIPILRYDVVPGDKFRVNTEVFLRFSPLVAPIMHRVNCFVHYFYVPYRLLWDNGKDDSWKQFITGGEDGLAQPVFPRVKIDPRLFTGVYGKGTLMDYMGINFGVEPGNEGSINEYSLLPFRAYQMIYNEFYRDQNLTPEVQFSRSGGDSNVTTQLLDGTDYETAYEAIAELFKLRDRAWEKDYFTSSLPFVQRGVAAQIPIGSFNPSIIGSGISKVYGNQNIASDEQAVSFRNYADASSDDIDFDNTVSSQYGYVLKDDGNRLMSGYKAPLAQQGMKTGINLNGTNSVSVKDIASKLNISGADLTAPTINELRLAEHLQKWLEKNARGGSRYIEQILSHFGVRVPDYRLDRPEYLGGGKTPVVIKDVPQTSSTDATSPQGNLAGQGYAVGAKNKFKYTFEEHGIVLGIMSVLPRTCYQQGVDRFFTKFDKFDYYFPEFANLGEQAVLNQEIYNDATSEESLETFGYQERFAEYKYRASEVHGDFKDSLNMWHMGRIFQNKPSLNTSFVSSNPTTRIFAVEQGVQHMWCQLYHNVRAIRPMPKHAIPSL